MTETQTCTSTKGQPIDPKQTPTSVKRPYKHGSTTYYKKVIIKYKVIYVDSPSKPKPQPTKKPAPAPAPKPAKKPTPKPTEEEPEPETPAEEEPETPESPGGKGGKEELYYKGRFRYRRS
ncbi:hypothetical protein TWF106_000028 [Orbilia oligospora]|nr:hypothetical protein TWF191_003685 [Orbilia oligospora]KAF3229641.1 hypothetical protein TWF106_000028 [Orbilia oligospora]KAF3262514.1 hypothetical protein TWF192_007187 [Orbilia oligospora]